MRSKKKYLIIFNIIFLLVYLISTAFFFSSEYGSIYRDYNDYQFKIEDFVNLCKSNYFETTDKIIYSIYDYLVPYPTIAAIYDDKGELINKSGSFVEFTDENWNKQYIDLEKYLTDDIRIQLQNSNISDLRNTKLRYTEKNNEFIPVSLLLYDEEIQFTEYKEYTTTFLEAEVTLIDIDTVWYQHRAYEKIKYILDNLNKEIKKHTEDIDYHFLAGHFDKDSTSYASDFKLNGRNYTLAIVSSTDLFFDTLSSQSFREMLSSFSIILFIIYIVLF
nr:hypothetical protein [Eubacterium sp.]